MIEYKSDRFQLFFIWQLRGSVLPRAFVFGFFSALLTAVLKNAEVQKLGFMQELGFDSEDEKSFDFTMYAGFASVVGFMLVFRTSQAMLRFTSGLDHLAGMNAQWYEACSSLVAFSETSTCSHASIRSFQHLCVRLFSMLNAAALQNVADIDAAPFEVIDNGTLDVESLALLEDISHNAAINKAHVIHHWIEHLVIDNIQKGGVINHIPPPILSRVFHELAQGNYEFQQALTITNVPFPYPYAQLTTVMLLFHGAITPFFVSMLSVHWSLAAIFTLVQVSTLWGINLVAAELQQPFQEDANDLPMSQMHRQTLESLALLLDERLKKAPYLETIKDITKHDNLCDATVRKSLTNMKRMSLGANQRLSRRRGSSNSSVPPRSGSLYNSSLNKGITVDSLPSIEEGTFACGDDGIVFIEGCQFHPGIWDLEILASPTLPSCPIPVPATLPLLILPLRDSSSGESIATATGDRGAAGREPPPGDANLAMDSGSESVSLAASSMQGSDRMRGLSV